jgi:imidazolonepropionase-like amidohydrolase
MNGETVVWVEDVSVLDVRLGTLRRNQSVRLDGQKIGWVGDAADAPGAAPGEKVVNGNGLTVLPGLIDCHVHLSHDGEANWMTRPRRTPAEETLGVVANAIRAIRAGTTTVRDCGSGPTRAPLAIALQPPVRDLLLPTVVSCGSAITMTGGHMFWEASEADGVEGVRRAVRAELKAGAQWIKVVATGGVLTRGTDVGGESYTLEELAAAVGEAGRGGRRVAAHAIGNAGIKNSLRAGVRTIEHGSYLDDEAIELMLEKGAFHVPTLSAYHQVVRNGTAGGVSAESVAKALSAHETNRESFTRSLAAGVPVAAGTDAGTPNNFHGELAFELQLMVEAGAAPIDAIRAATVNAAAALDLSDAVGDVEIGKTADLVLVDGDPSEDIASLAQPAVVIKQGRIAFERGAEVSTAAADSVGLGVG